jgi:uncharacterized repeat protein (TIGR03833 family)
MVKVVQKDNQKTGKLTEGTVKEILTKSSSHPFGIKVLLENGTIGRVKEVTNNFRTSENWNFSGVALAIPINVPLVILL